ncbi:MAG: DNA repair protein RecO [Prevotella sp.]|nr:DNA repair protein RecO [Prevotella sp.]
MLIKTEAIVLHSLKYGESRMIVDLFTRQQGRLSCIVSIPKTSKAKIKKQLFQPLTLIDVESDIRPRVQLQKLRDARLLHTPLTLHLSPAKMAISLFLAEFLYHALRGEQQPDEQLFDYMKHSFLWLDAAHDGYANFHLSFLMHLSRFLGFYPNLSNQSPLTPHQFFDLRESCFCEAPPLHADFLHPEEAARIHDMMRMDYQNMHLFRMSRTDRNRCLDVMLTYYRLHLPSFPELKSLPVLKELFD